MIAVIDYGVGNLFSLKSSLAAIGQEAVVTRDQEELDRADHILLPGVGAFGDAVEKLRSTGMDRAVLRRGSRCWASALGCSCCLRPPLSTGSTGGLG